MLIIQHIAILFLGIMKIVISIAFAYILCSRLQAQPRIIIDFKPSFDKPASVHIQVNPQKQIQIVFNQAGTYKSKQAAFKWLQDTATIIHVRKLGIYFQQFAFSDTIHLKADKAATLFKTFTEVYSNRDRLSKLKDSRLMLDGMPCLVTISNEHHPQYQLAYRPPALVETQLIDHLIRAILATLRVKSANPATVNYCMVIEDYLQ